MFVFVIISLPVQDMMQEVQRHTSFTASDVVVMDNIREGVVSIHACIKTTPTCAEIDQSCSRQPSANLVQMSAEQPKKPTSCSSSCRLRTNGNSKSDLSCSAWLLAIPAP